MSIDHTKLTIDELFELFELFEPAGQQPKRAELMSIAEAANTLGVSLRTIRRWEAAGRMPPRFKCSRRWDYRRSDIEALLAQQNVEA
jgi:excisionase family DNA binding protein